MHVRRHAFTAPLIALGMALATAAPAAAQDQPRLWLDAKRFPDERVKLVLAQMTDDEKLSLVFGYFGTDFPPKKKLSLVFGYFGIDFQPKNGYKTPAEARPGSAGYVPGIPRLGIPAQWQTDAGVGVATPGGAAKKRGRTALPSGLATTASWDVELAHAGGAMIGAEARASGFNMMLAGGVNLMREPRNGRNFEYGGEDPLLAGTMVGAQIAGIQSNHVVSTVKHYAVNDQETDRDTGNSIIDQGAARTSDLLAFQIAIEKGDPGSVMCSYNLVNGTHACENPWLLTDVLRRDWGYKGYVMSDWGATHSTAPAANAGLDQDSGFPFDKAPYFGAPLKEAVAKGEVSHERLDAMVGAILHAMFANGLVDKPMTEAPMDLAPAMLARHAEVTRADAEGGAVLLQNRDAILPLSPAVKKIVLIGGRADKGVLAGSGSSLVFPVGGNAVPGLEPKGWPGPVMFYPDAPLAAIKRQAPNAEVAFTDGTDAGDAAQLAKDADVAIVFATQWAGESFDVALNLDDDQNKLIAAVAKANSKTVVVLETGGPVLTPWRDQVSGILAAWYPGTQGGGAIANLLFGKVNPSGRLPATFPASLDQLPKPSVPNKGDTTYSEGATVGYKWYDAKGLIPAFAFGHGLSYTSFVYSELAARAEDGTVTASFTICNTGHRKGKDVLQLYVSATGWEAPKRLGAFAKVELTPSEAKKLVLKVDPRLLATFDTASNSWRIAGGTYQVMLGTSARDIAATVPVELKARTIAVGWRS